MKYLSFLLMINFIISSCNLIDIRRIEGNNKITTKTYDFKKFKSIDAGGNVAIYLKQDSFCSVKLETDENLIPYLKVQEMDGTLEIRTKNGVNLRPSDEVKFLVSMPQADILQISGASKVQTTAKFMQESELKVDLSGASTANISARAPRIELDASGASTLTIDGETKDLTAGSSGASTINGFNLKSENADVGASGASNTRVFASISLTAEASGASGVRYRGNPKVSSNSSGASSVKKDE